MAGAQRHDSPLLAPTLDLLDDLGPLPDDITVHLDAGYDSGKTRDTATLTERGLHGEIADKGEKAPIQATQRWHVERTNARTTASTGCSAATNDAKPSSMRSSTSPMRSSPRAA